MDVRFRVTRKRLVVLVTAAALATAGAAAYAAIPTEGTNVYNGCLLRATGTIRLVDPSLSSTSLLSHCTSFEQPFSWNQKGTPGKDGVNGTNGAPGANGTDGKNGANGAPCLASDPACVGPVGPTGPAGKDGANGTDGRPGADGAACSSSDPLCRGPKGDTGETGAAGPQGLPGTATPAVRTVTIVPTRGFGASAPPIAPVPVFTSLDFGTLEVTCSVDSIRTTTSSVGVRLRYVDTTAGGSTLLAATESVNSGLVRLAPGVSSSVGTATLTLDTANPALTPDVFTAREFTITRFTTVNGSPYFSSQHMSVGIELLPDLSCRISTTTTNDQ